MEAAWGKETITLFKHYGYLLAWQQTLWRKVLQVTCHYVLTANQAPVELRPLLNIVLKIYLNEVGRRGRVLCFCSAHLACSRYSPSISDPTGHKSVIIHKIPSWGLKNEKNGNNLFQIQKIAFGEDIILLLLRGSCIYPYPSLRAIISLTFLYYNHKLQECCGFLWKLCGLFFYGILISFKIFRGESLPL